MVLSRHGRFRPPRSFPIGFQSGCLQVAWSQVAKPAPRGGPATAFGRGRDPYPWRKVRLNRDQQRPLLSLRCFPEYFKLAPQRRNLADTEKVRLLAILTGYGNETSAARRERDCTLLQIALFQPRGLFGLMYWYAVLPSTGVIFRGMLAGIQRDAVQIATLERAG